jgi:fibronectin type 3 domain-containing protein
VSGTGFGMTGGGSPVQLASSQSVTVDVEFDPSAAGNYAGALMVSSNASDSSVNVPLAGAVTAPPSAPASVGLRWNASTSIVNGYNVYRGGASSGPFTRVNPSLVPGLSYTDQSVTAGATYYYVTTAVDPAGVESGYSNAAEAVVP